MGAGNFTYFARGLPAREGVAVVEPGGASHVNAEGWPGMEVGWEFGPGKGRVWDVPNRTSKVLIHTMDSPMCWTSAAGTDPNHPRERTKTMITIQTKFGPREIDLTKVPQVSIDRAIRIGITNILRDSYASDKDDASRKASMESALAHFMEGTAPERGRSADPVAAEAKAIATAILKAKGVKPDADDYKAKLAALVGHEKVVAKAKANVKAREALVADLDI